MRECPKFPVCNSLGRHTHQGRGEGADFAIADAWDGNEWAMRMLDCALGLLASLAGYTPQSLLRDINPRMHPWPSDEAIDAHGGRCVDSGDPKSGGWWVAGKEGRLHAGRFLRGSFMIHYSPTGGEFVISDRDDGWTFWPIDANGNKVAWPMKDGVML